jgi:competence protein ComEC
MRVSYILLCVVLVLSFAAGARAAATLDVYVIDVEGGKAVIIQNPSGQSMLIDGGMPNDRDLQRVSAAAEAAGIKQFDIMMITHYDADHVGNIPRIYAKFPAKLLVDHGPLLPNPKLAAGNRRTADAYVAFLPGKKRLSVKPGDVLPFKDVKITVLISNEQPITKPLAGAGQPNSACPATLPEAIRGDDNSASIGTLWQFGKFRMADFGDLLQWAEMRLMCPVNPVGKVDLYLVNHHGLALSNSPALVYALAPKVAITNNGERKGIAPEVVKTLRGSPRIQDVWQLHYSTTAGPELNAPEQFIANMKAQDCKGFAIKVSASRDGSFTVTNLRNNFSKAYKP